MHVTADFECGGGRRLTELGEGHWRLEAVGDPAGYDKHFCVKATNPSETTASLRLEVYPDAELGAAGAAFFHSHFPSNIWCCGDDWRRWRPVRNTWEDAVSFEEDHIDIQVPLPPGGEMYFATNPIRRYSDMLAWLAGMQEKHGERLQRQSLGPSAEGRDIPVARISGTGSARPKLLVLAGQHPSEHCGNWASEGIVEYVLSSISEAREIGDHFDLAVVPMINPDGNVGGLSGANAEGVNLFSDFEPMARGEQPEATESRALWEWLGSEFQPDVILHFHGYMGWKQFCTPPYDGVYLLTDPEALYDAKQLAAYRAIQDRLMFETPAYTASWNPGALGEESIEHHLAANFGTLSAFYEINSASVGAFEQFRRGPQVVSAVARALMQDVRPLW